jgi:hypothetical protein
MTTEIKNITLLTQASEFKKLQDISTQLTHEKTQFDLLSVFEDLIDENAWSRLFAYLFDSKKSHGFQQKAFFEWIKIENELQPDLDKFQRKLPKENECEIITITEWYTEKNRRLDILIKIIDKNLSVKAVIGIENKVNSGEQSEQVSDYQKSLIKSFPNIPSIIFFLTPDGRKPLTSLTSDICPCLSHSYQSIIKVCEKLDSQTTTQSHVFVKALQQHLSKLLNINSMENQIRETIYKLYKDPKYRQAIKLIAEYTPNIRTVFDSLKEQFKELPEGFNLPLKYSYEESSSYITTTECDFQIYFKDFENICEGVYTYYFLHSENPSPDIDDKIFVRIMLYIENPSKDKKTKQELRDKILKCFNIPNNNKDQIKHWWQWVNVWVSESYSIKDLGSIDTEELTKFASKTIKDTHQSLKKSLVSLSNKIN